MIALSGNFPYAIGMAQETDSDGNFYVDRSRWMDYLATRRDITHGEFRVGYFIASKVNPTDRCMWWNVDEIARAIGVSNITVSKTTAKLDKLDLMVITKGPKGSNRYGLRLPFDPEAERLRFRPKRRLPPRKPKSDS